jgi:hypothetical protein
VSAPFTSPARRDPGQEQPPRYGHDKPAEYGEDDTQTPGQLRTSRRGTDVGGADVTAVFGLNKGSTGADVAPRRQRTAARTAARAGAGPDGSPRPASRPPRGDARRGRKSVLGLGPKGWLWTCAAVAAVAAIAVVAMTVFRPGPDGPAHTLVTPSRLGTFSRSATLTRQMDVSELEKNIIAQSSGQASHLVSAVYQAGSPVSGGSSTQVMLFIGGQLSGASPDASVKSFIQHFKGASMTSAGSMAGEAACVSAQSGTEDSTVCAWFDNDTFGELVSPNMSVSTLAGEMRTIRPSVEHVVKN